MKEFDEAKKEYESIPIPKELDAVVKNAIRQGRKNSMTVCEGTGKGQNMKKSNVWKVAACVAVVLVGGFTAALNSSSSFAKAAENIPVLGSVAKVLTFRTYSYKDDEKEVTVDIPEVTMPASATDTSGDETINQNDTKAEKQDYLEHINQMIQDTVAEYEDNADEQIAEYKDAFIATGGTEEEFKDKNITVDVSYAVKCETETMVSFVLSANESWCGAYDVSYFYNINLEDGKEITLKDLLGDDYIEIANKQIKEQMEQRVKADDTLTYFGEDMDGFTSITDDTNFYIGEDGNPVVVFAKYEVAPGFMGAQEFEIIK